MLGWWLVQGFYCPLYPFFVVIIIHNPWLMGIPFLTNQFAMAWRCRSSTLLNGMSPVRLSWYHGELHLHKFGEFTPTTVVIHVHTMLYIYIYPLISGTALPHIPSRLTGHLHGKPLKIWMSTQKVRMIGAKVALILWLLRSHFCRIAFPVIGC